jgi:hypothetical protein
MLLERFLAIAKLTAISMAIVVAILCLSYSNAYGLTTPMQLTKPSEQSQTSPNSTGTISSTQFDFDAEVDDGFNIDDVTLGAKETCPPIPEPTTLILLGFGLAGIKLLKRRN